MKSSYISEEPELESESYVLDRFDSDFAHEKHTENKDLERRIYIYTEDPGGEC